MNIATLRKKFPEYGDLTDQDLTALCTQMLSDIADPEDEQPEDVNAVGVVDALESVTASLDKANKTLLSIANKSEKEAKDMAPHFMALGVYLQNIEKAVYSLAVAEKPEIKAESVKTAKSFRIKRDDFGNIESVIPQY